MPLHGLLYPGSELYWSGGWTCLVAGPAVSHAEAHVTPPLPFFGPVEHVYQVAWNVEPASAHYAVDGAPGILGRPCGESVQSRETETREKTEYSAAYFHRQSQS